MKAVRFHEHGGIEELRCEEVADPVAGPGEMVVLVRACAINYLDLRERAGLPAVRIPLPHIPGSDVSGIVESVRPGVGPRHELFQVLQLVQTGYLRPVVSAVLPLEEAGRGQQMIENREHFGKVVLAVP